MVVDGIYPMIVDGHNITYSNHCDETCYFNDNPTASLLIEIVDASVNIDTLFCSTINMAQAPNLREQAKNNNDLNKVDAINSYNQQNGLRWVADYNSIVGNWFFDKKHLLGEKYNYLGFEYYRGGIFETVFTSVEPVETDMVAYFDWRNRHDANVPGTPYFDGDDTTFTGWHTPIKNQKGCGACWAFSSNATLEVVSNLYFNIPDLNTDFSEQELISCTDSIAYNDCDTGGFVSTAFTYYKIDSIGNDSCFLYQHANADETDCDTSLHCTTPEYTAKIENYKKVNDSYLDTVLLSLINSGPMQIMLNGPHGVTLTGYIYNKESSEIYWIYENNYGSSWGINENGFGIVLRSYKELYPFAITTPVTIINSNPNSSPVRHWYDNDADGIYWWGIGPKPDSCPGNAYNRDCNDNNPALGGYDANYNCVCLMPYQFTPIVINNDSTWWGYDKLVDRDIEIDSGATLTIFNTVKMTDNARIIVKRGAKLVINGGTLTNLCNNRWKGIEVWGTSNLLQDEPGAQGIVELINDATIENAITGIETIKKTNPNYPQQSASLNYSGGIVNAENATIKNCETAIKFWPYPYHTNPDSVPQDCNSKSVFSNTDFLINDDDADLWDKGKFKSMIHLNGINGVIFETVKIENNRLYADTKDTIYGIYANNSNFELSSAADTNTLYMFTYGIFSISSTAAANGFTTIMNTSFKNKMTSIYLSKPYNQSSPVVVSNNNIHCWSDNTLRPTGIYIDNTSSYFVNENTVYGGYQEGFSQITEFYGLVINNSGLEDNRIYNNTFYDLHYGIQSQYSNRDERGEHGLELKCNDYSFCKYDEMILGKQPILDTYGIKWSQGSGGSNTKDPAGNTFHIDTAAQFIDIYNNTNDIIYWYHDSTTGPRVKPYRYSESLVDIQTNINIALPYEKTNSCPPDTTFSGGKDAGESRAEMTESSIEADSLNNELSLLVDAGNTENLNDDVQNSWPDETMEVRQELLDASPYLSDTVMISAAEKEDVLPNSILTEVLVANPQSAKSNKIMDAVDTRDTLLNQTQYDQVMQGKLTAGAKEKLESRLSAARGKHNFAMKNLIMAWHEDTLVNATDSIIALFEDENKINAKYALIDNHLNQWDTISAVSEYNLIDLNFELGASEYSNWQNYNNWLAYRVEQIIKGKSITEPDSSQLVSLYQLYNITDNQLKTVLRNLLRFSDTLTYKEPYLAVNTSFKESKVRFRPVGNPPAENELLIYPNPASNYFIVDYSGFDFNDNSAILSIYTIYGKQKETELINSASGFKVVDIRMWTPGAYVISLKTKGKPLGAKTVLVTR